MTVDCTAFCKALADDTRQQILQMLMKKEMSVGDIVDSFNMSQPSISHHLSLLKQFGLVTSRKEGQKVFYAINRERAIECCGRLIAIFDAQEACQM